jgi:hypothetical protein
VCFEDRKLFPEQLETGMAFEGLPPGSVTPNMPADTVYIVTEIYPSHVVLDGNHPLAGMALRMDIQVRGVREATEAEIRKPQRQCRRVSGDGAGPVASADRRRAALSISAAGGPEAAFTARRIAKFATRRKRACTTGTMTICAMRSSGCTVKAASLRFQQLTISGPW